MGILNALGLMTTAEHKRLVGKIEGERDKFRDQVRDTCGRAELAEDQLKIADRQLSAAVRARDTLQHDLEAANDKFTKAITDLAAAQDEIASLKPDAEAMRAKRKRDRDQKASKAMEKVAALLDEAYEQSSVRNLAKKAVRK